MVRALAIDVGTSSVRTALVDQRGVVSAVHQQRLTLASPAPGEVELDAGEIARLVLELARATLDEGPADVVGVTNQRATTMVFDVQTGQPVGPTLGWQDLRTVLDCLVLQGEGLRLAPNQSATKARWLVEHANVPAARLRMATLESWVTWVLTAGAHHVSDRSNAAITGLVNLAVDAWDPAILATLGLDPGLLARLVDTMGEVGPAVALPGSPPITALIGDQPASLFGQSRVHGGAKITFGTGAMLNVVREGPGPRTLTRFDSGCFPVVVRSRDGVVTWGVEGIVLSAGACVDWLVDLGLLARVEDAEDLATSVPDAAGVSFVPAMSGLGTPQWDFGARSAFFGVTRGAGRAHLVRAVLEGVAQRGADLIEAGELEVGATFDEVRVDGGMSVNRFLLQRLADFSGRDVAASREREATTRGAGLMALVGADLLGLDDVAATWEAREHFTPHLDDAARSRAREQWRDVVARAARTIPELSEVHF